MNVHIHEKNIEIEFRLGKQTRKGFVTDIGKVSYEKLSEALSVSRNWDAIRKEEYVDVFYENGVRKRNNCETVLKEDLHKQLFKIDSNNHLRLCISVEKPKEPQGKSIKQRHKRRTSYVYSFYRYDLTYVLNEETYEIEMEIDDVEYARRHNEAFITKIMVDNFKALLKSANL